MRIRSFNELGQRYWLPTLGVWWDRGLCFYVRVGDFRVVRSFIGYHAARPTLRCGWKNLP